MKIKNLKINKRISKKVTSFALVSVLGVTTLTGCGNYDFWDTQYTFNKIIIVNGDSATIVNAKKWTDFDGEQIQIETPEGLVFVSNSDNIYLLDVRNTDVSAEEFAKSLIGEEGRINYLGSETNQKTK